MVTSLRAVSAGYLLAPWPAAPIAAGTGLGGGADVASWPWCRGNLGWSRLPSPLPGLILTRAEWLRALADAGPQREAALARLHEMLVRIARSEARRRGPRLQLTGLSSLLAALHRAVDEELTARQRRVFVAIVLNGVPLDSLVIEMASNRNAIYKTMFDARRKLRAALAANGYLPDDHSRRS